QLLFLRAFPESLAKVVRYESDRASPRFGQPLEYLVTVNDPNLQSLSEIGPATGTMSVHWSRAIHVADGLGSSEVFGTPRMQPVLNRLLDLRKLYGGSAEMYWKGAFPGFGFQSPPEFGGDVDVDVASLRETTEAYMNGLQRYLVATGLQIEQLAPQVVDPTPQILTQIEAICIQIGVPKRVFAG